MLSCFGIFKLKLWTKVLKFGEITNFHNFIVDQRNTLLYNGFQQDLSPRKAT